MAGAELAAEVAAAAKVDGAEEVELAEVAEVAAVVEVERADVVVKVDEVEAARSQPLQLERLEPTTQRAATTMTVIMVMAKSLMTNSLQLRVLRNILGNLGKTRGWLLSRAPML